MHATRQPLQVWFWAAYLVSTQTPGMSALQFQRQLGMKRYETAFQLLHKLRSGMMRPDRDPIGGEYPVEVDESFVGGRTKGKGRGVTNAPLVIAAVEVHTRESEKLGRLKVYAGRIRLWHITSRSREDLEAFVSENVIAGSIVRTDGCNGYDNLVAMGYQHDCVVLDGDVERIQDHLPLVHIAFSNLKTWLRGTHHGVSPQHLQTYLNEYAFRFNRRFYPMTSFASVLGIGTVNEAPTYEGLYDGEWEHKRNPPEGFKSRRRRAATGRTARARRRKN
jgi:transposase-like protein